MDIFMREGKLVQGYKAIKSEFHKFLERNILGKEIRIEFTDEYGENLNGYVSLTVKTIHQVETFIKSKLFIINNIGVYIDEYSTEENYLIIKNRDKSTVVIVKEDEEPWK